MINGYHGSFQLECNGVGVCECGKCKCTNPKYFGSHCQECDVSTQIR